MIHDMFYKHNQIAHTTIKPSETDHYTSGKKHVIFRNLKIDNA